MAEYTKEPYQRFMKQSYFDVKRDIFSIQLFPSISVLLYRERAENNIGTKTGANDKLWFSKRRSTQADVNRTNRRDNLHRTFWQETCLVQPEKIKSDYTG